MPRLSIGWPDVDRKKHLRSVLWLLFAVSFSVVGWVWLRADSSRGTHQKPQFSALWSPAISQQRSGCQDVYLLHLAGPTAMQGYTKFLSECLPSRIGLLVVCPSIAWEIVLYQRPQHMAVALGGVGWLVLYIEVPARDAVTEHTYLKRVAPGVFRCNSPALLYHVSGAVVTFYSTSWQYSPVQYARVRNNGNVVVYEYVDHHDALIVGSGWEFQQLKRNFQYVNSATFDFAVASASILRHELCEKMGGCGRVLMVSNGVDIRHYVEGLAQTYQRPVAVALRAVVLSGKPVVGYFGALARWLDYALVEGAAQAMPDVYFVFIGPDYDGGSQLLPILPNILWLGAVSYDILIDYARHFTVGFIPFAKGQIARTTSPLKLFEYFALGKPTVTTAAMRECVVFSEVFRGAGVVETVAAIRAAVRSAEDPQFVRRLHSLARANSWEVRAANLHSFIEQLHPQFHRIQC